VAPHIMSFILMNFVEPTAVPSPTDVPEVSVDRAGRLVDGDKAFGVERIAEG
jgi:hypothetical protein